MEGLGIWAKEGTFPLVDALDMADFIAIAVRTFSIKTRKKPRMPGENPPNMIRLIRLARPQFLLASLVLFTMGAAWAIILGAEPGFWKLLWGYLIVFSAQLSVSFSNDYFDVGTDRFGDPSLFAGGSGILVWHPELKVLARRAAVALILLSLALGLLFTIHYSYPAWFFGLILIGNLLGWFYAAPPLRLAYRGLGEISTSIAAGAFLPGMGYMAATGALDGNGLVIMIPLLLIGLAFILSVEIPDMEADRLGGKKTWVARRGRVFGFHAVGILLLAAAGYYFLIPAAVADSLPVNFRILCLFSLVPLCAAWIGIIERPEEKRESTFIVNTIIGAMIAFFVLTDTYLVYLAIQ
jgi:1,4-dihydroxy-2-naphthoate octaprenyltransferase